ncbi:RNA-directed DNA polymerase from mobile element jockey [Trichonephila clavipes]|nr:RNA-directed DNA polymerase from mobile element jockey [Trichonephila clavipes]
MESFTFQFPEEKEYRVVIKGLPADMPVEDILEELEEMGIHPKECRVMISRKTGQPMPLFSVFLEKNPDNRNIYNLKELCSMKIEVDTMRKKFGPAQCYRCQGFFHSSRFCTRNPKCVKCGKPHLTRDCTKKREEDPTCCHCQGNHPANFTGCPRNPLNRPPPPPKVNFWEERARKKKEMLDAAKEKSEQAKRAQNEAPVQAQETSSSRKIQTPPSAPTEEPQARDPSSSNTTFSPTCSQAARPSTTSQNPSSLSEVFSQVNDPEVSNRPLKLITWNSNGIIHKIAELEDFIHRHDPDVIAIQETFLQPCHNLSLSNYITHRNDRLSHRGGGTAILIKRTIAHHSLDLRTHTLENTTIVIEGAKKLTISCIYRPPSSPAQAIVPDLLRIFRNRTCCVVLGDFNAKHKSWNPHSRGNACGAQLHKFSKDCGYLITAPAEPTTVPHSARNIPSTLDFAISCGLSDIRVETHVDLSSDHNPVQFSIKSSPKPYTQNCTAFTNWNLFQELLTTSIQGNPVISDTDDIESKISQFTSSIHQAINQSSKFKVITHDITFIPQALRLKITEKNRIRKLWQSTRFPPLKQTLNNLQRQIKHDMKSAKKKAREDLLDEANHNIDRLHNLIKMKKKKQITYPPLLGYRGLVYGTLEKANLFADTLEESFKENADPYDDEHIEKVERKVRRYMNNLSFHTPPLTSPGEVCEIITALANRKAPGADQIKNIALKSLPINAITFLTKIFNRCLMEGYFPEAWKHAVLTLLPKNGKDNKLAINYRPISLLSAVGKIFEKIILQRIKLHADANNCIPDFQHGFREETSTCHQLLRLTNLIIGGYNQNQTTGGAFLDAEKAFDRVWHDGLIFKLIQLNFPSYIIKIINSYLSDRTFQVKIDKTLSRIAPISAGCPQGSILSPSYIACIHMTSPPRQR